MASASKRAERDAGFPGTVIDRQRAAHYRLLDENEAV